MKQQYDNDILDSDDIACVREENVRRQVDLRNHIDAAIEDWKLAHDLGPGADDDDHKESSNHDAVRVPSVKIWRSTPDTMSDSRRAQCRDEVIQEVKQVCSDGTISIWVGQSRFG
jgi:hypothetical protein